MRRWWKRKELFQVILFLPPALCEVSCLQTFAYTPLFCPVFHLGKSFTAFKIQLWYPLLWDAFLDLFSLNVAHSPLYPWGLAPIWVFVFLTLSYDYIPHCPQPYLRNIYYRGWAELVISLYAHSTMYSDWHGQNFCKYFINEQGLSERRMKRGQPPKESLKFPLTSSLYAPGGLGCQILCGICAVSSPL